MPREYSSGVCHSLLRDSERARLTCTQYIRLLMLQKLLLKSEIYAHAQTVFNQAVFSASATTWVRAGVLYLTE